MLSRSSQYCFLVFYCFLFLLLSCQKEDYSLPAQTKLNVAFGTDSLQKMDVYLPAGRNMNSTKVMIMIHGGAWSTGDKSELNVYIDTLKKRLPDYAIFNINHRLSNGTTIFFPTQENDVKAAIEFIAGKSGEYNVSQKIVLLGVSSGAHLALLQGYKHNSSGNVKAIVDFFGPTDLIDLYNNPASPFIPPSTIAQIVGATPTTNLTLYQESSPINYVTAQSPPTIILHGGLDPLVSPSQSVSLDNKLQMFGVIHQYVFYPTELHGWSGPNLTDSFNKIEVFLAANVN